MTSLARTVAHGIVPTIDIFTHVHTGLFLIIHPETDEALFLTNLIEVHDTLAAWYRSLAPFGFQTRIVLTS